MKNAMSRMNGKMINAQKILVRKCEEKRLIGKPRNIKEDNIKMDLIQMYVNVWNGFM
jgi:hypothetical protein